MAAGSAEYYTAAERRIEYFTAGVGAAGALVALVVWGLKSGAGVAGGAAVSWLNYRWMRLGVAALARVSKPGAEGEKPRVPAGTYLRAMGRYALLVGGAYVMLHVFKLPVISLLAGFSAVLAGVLVEAISQLFRSRESAATRP